MVSFHMCVYIDTNRHVYLTIMYVCFHMHNVCVVSLVVKRCSCHMSLTFTREDLIKS